MHWTMGNQTKSLLSCLEGNTCTCFLVKMNFKFGFFWVFWTDLGQGCEWGISSICQVQFIGFAREKGSYIVLGPKILQLTAQSGQWLTGCTKRYLYWSNVNFWLGDYTDAFYKGTNSKLFEFVPPQIYSNTYLFRLLCASVTNVFGLPVWFGCFSNCLKLHWAILQEIWLKANCHWGTHLTHGSVFQTDKHSFNWRNIRWQLYQCNKFIQFFFAVKVRQMPPCRLAQIVSFIPWPQWARYIQRFLISIATGRLLQF